MQQNYEVKLKTSMREAFEAVTKFSNTTITKLVLKGLQTNNGVIFRKRMWSISKSGR
jgi:hypothetical protein